MTVSYTFRSSRSAQNTRSRVHSPNVSGPRLSCQPTNPGPILHNLSVEVEVSQSQHNKSQELQPNLREQVSHPQQEACWTQAPRWRHSVPSCCLTNFTMSVMLSLETAAMPPSHPTTQDRCCYLKFSLILKSLPIIEKEAHTELHINICTLFYILELLHCY